jgi:aldehyde:ferredoxin oxidoreductase
MGFGYVGKILRVNLSDGRIWTESPDDKFYRTYMGGRNIIAYYLLKEAPRDADPLGPDNPLIFATGVLTGIPIGYSGRNSAGAYNPLTGGYGESESGGFFGAELKFAGFDAIVIQGQSPKPVYLWIHDGQAELRDASRLWGLKTAEALEAVKDELGERRIRSASIGPAAEKLVRYASIANDITHFYGRCGMGAVMGSKRLKGIYVRGSHKQVPVADPAGIQRCVQAYRERGPSLEECNANLGTIGGLEALSAAGALPTYNFRAGSFAGAQKITGATLAETLLIDRDSCFACRNKCKRVVEAHDPYEISPTYGGPEYETGAALGSLVGVDDLAALCKANEICNAYTIDTIAAGVNIAWAMECFERGLLTKEDTGGLELRFGDGDMVVRLVQMIAERQGFGDLLAEGVYRASQKIGRGTEQYAMHVKGQELPMHEPRAKHLIGLGYAVSPTGADHVHNVHDVWYEDETNPMFNRIRSLGILEPIKATELTPEKVRLFVYDVNWWSLFNVLELCFGQPYMTDFLLVAEAVRAATGWNTNMFELTKVGERSVTLARAVNVRRGMTAKDDTLPARFFEPIEASPKGVPLDRQAFQESLQLYYAMMGWDDAGIPTRAKLIELGVGWAWPLMQEGMKRSP